MEILNNFAVKYLLNMLTTEQRSYVMSRIRSKNTKPELIVRKFLFSKGFRYRIHVKALPGSPDIVLRKYHTVIFINGCFWHAHNCVKPAQTHVDYWNPKIDRNLKRDRDSREQLKRLGWYVMVIWECQLKPKERTQTLEGIQLLLEKAFLMIHQK